MALLKNGLDENAKSPIVEETSLHLVVRAALGYRCGLQTLQALLDHGAQLSAQNYLGQTVYHYIANIRG